MLCLLKAILIWLAINVIGLNIVSFTLRGLLWRQPIQRESEEEYSPHDWNSAADAVVPRGMERIALTNFALTALGFVLAAAYLAITYYYFGISISIVAAIVMLLLLPDILWKVRIGAMFKPFARSGSDRQGSRISINDMPKTPMHLLASILNFLTIPVLIYLACFE